VHRELEYPAVAFQMMLHSVESEGGERRSQESNRAFAPVTFHYK
jgi:hypothetical protein